MTTAAVTPGTSLQAAVERFITGLLDQAKANALRGRLSAATVRRLIARDLAELLAAHLEPGGS